MYLKEKISSFPILLKGWAMKNGNQILLSEINAPDMSYSIIDISNESKPVFKGYKKSKQPVFGTSYLHNSSHVWDASPVTYFSKDKNLLSCSVELVSSFIFSDSDFVLASSLPKASFNNNQIMGFKRGPNDTMISVFTQQYMEPCTKTFYSFIPLRNSMLGNPIDVVGFRLLGSVTHCLDYERLEKGYLIDKKLILRYSPGIYKYPIGIKIIDYSDSFLNPYSIYLDGQPDPYDASKYPAGDSLNNKTYNEISLFNPVKYVGNYLIYDTTLRAFDFSFVDSTNKTVFFVSDSLLSIYKYDTVPQTGIIIGNDRSKRINLKSAVSLVHQSRQTVALSFSKAQNSAQLRIYSLTGRLIKQQESNNTTLMQTDMKMFKNGIYLFKVTFDSRNETFLVKKL
jgi:hypothetical protein